MAPSRFSGSGYQRPAARCCRNERWNRAAEVARERGETVTDVFFNGREVKRWRRRRIHTRSTHGTGCTLSAAVAAGLALAQPLVDAVEQALDYVQRALLAAPGLGGGNGPLNHLVAAPGSRVPTTSP